MRMCISSPGSECATTQEVDAGVCNEEKCDSVKEIQQKSAPDPTPKPEPEVEISDWSECKGDRKWQYRKVCEEGKRCK